MLFQKKVIRGDIIFLGDYMISNAQKKLCNNYQPLEYFLSEESVTRVRNILEEKLQSHGYANFEKEGEYLVAKKMRMNYMQPQVGDLRVKFTYVPCGPITIVGQQFCFADNFVLRKWKSNRTNYEISKQYSSNPFELFNCLHFIDEFFNQSLPIFTQFVIEKQLEKDELFDTLEKESQHNPALFFFIGYLIMYLAVLFINRAVPSLFSIFFPGILMNDAVDLTEVADLLQVLYLSVFFQALVVFFACVTNRIIKASICMVIVIVQLLIPFLV
mmetsp:Transcript_4898/g.4518  ORF Transcript_4898/g.4518 Transcript_4898/m.4518 type:complete len:272 (-) Transcript_4898:27-842(-)